ncbi:MAG: glutamine--fructose-6-phosphate transaminase (isomerizing) [Caldiserica bacterium]|nr:glutamine--fructose-6-phosphate transaminase (isomerizing) [Caldisericota bacterium]MDH7563053.1 glutamine--fructose-6-phosphate transaminase (isomerizing) [Caldisericota bacterium]
MCGIFGIVFPEEKEDLGKILVKAGQSLTYRGYDSVGCAAFSKDGEVDLKKDVGRISEVDSKYSLSSLSGIRGIVQLRWATFGIPCQRNSQPHFDCDGDLVGAHNGNVINTISLREEFQAEGHLIRGENDGEIVVHAVERHFDRTRDLKRAMIHAALDLKGDYAYLVSHREENAIYAAKMGSSLYAGIGNGFSCVSSDLPSILDLTDNILVLKDGEGIKLTPEDYELFDLKTGEEIFREPGKCPYSRESASKGGFPHFMIKEIYEQPKKVQNLLDYLEVSPEFEDFSRTIEGADRVFLIGSGSSYHACLVGSYYLNKVASRAAVPVPAGAFIEQFGNSLSKDDILLCVSQSGETKDVINVVNYARDISRGRVLSFVNVLGSTLSLRSEAFLPIVCDLEISVPATKTFINQLVLFLSLSCKIGGRGLHQLKDLPGLLEKTINSLSPQVQELSSELLKFNDFYCLGYGVTHGIALEGALKIKEVVYNHSEGAYSSEFKHGPLAIVYSGYPVLFISTIEDSSMVISHINEVSCREGKVITISPPHPLLEKYSDLVLPLPTGNFFLVPILGTIPLQMLAYFMSVGKGNDPDFPRNISKTLTVD